MVAAGKLPAIPLPKVLFRPEEVVLPSGAAPVDNALLRSHLYERTPIDFDMNAVDAVSTGVIQRQPVVPVLAADQQQKVHRSRHPEPFSGIQGHCVEGESQALREPAVILCQLEAGWTAAVGNGQEAKSAQHPDGVLRLT